MGHAMGNYKAYTVAEVSVTLHVMANVITPNTTMNMTAPATVIFNVYCRLSLLAGLNVISTGLGSSGISFVTESASTLSNPEKILKISGMIIKRFSLISSYLAVTCMRFRLSNNSIHISRIS